MKQTSWIRTSSTWRAAGLASPLGVSDVPALLGLQVPLCCGQKFMAGIYIRRGTGVLILAVTGKPRNTVFRADLPSRLGQLLLCPGHTLEEQSLVWRCHSCDIPSILEPHGARGPPCCSPPLLALLCPS